MAVFGDVAKRVAPTLMACNKILFLNLLILFVWVASPSIFNFPLYCKVYISLHTTSMVNRCFLVIWLYIAVSFHNWRNTLFLV